MKMLDLFSGIGGFSLAASWAGIKTVAFCEIDPFCQKVLRKYWPDVPIYSDIRDLRGSEIGTVDIVSGGFPCQPFSTPGKRKGKQDERYLWPEMLRVIKETKPSWIVGENVIGLDNGTLDEILSDLESLGYETAAFEIPACVFGANHERYRIFIVGYSDSKPKLQADKKIKPFRSEGYSRKSTPRFDWGNICRAYWEIHQPPILGVDDGIPDRVDRSRVLGNAIVPQVAYVIFRAIREVEAVMTA